MTILNFSKINKQYCALVYKAKSEIRYYYTMSYTLSQT